MTEKADKVSWCAGAEPVILNATAVERIENAEGIEDVGHFVTEMIAIIMTFQHIAHFFSCYLQLFCHGVNLVMEHRLQLLLRYATYRIIL